MPGPGKSKKSSSTRPAPYYSRRQGSVRKKEDFEEVREQFESLKMSSISAPQGPPGSVPAHINAGNGGPQDLVVHEEVHVAGGGDSTDPTVLHVKLSDILKQREQPLKLLDNFTKGIDVVSRRKLTGLQNAVTYYNQ